MNVSLAEIVNRYRFRSLALLVLLYVFSLIILHQGSRLDAAISDMFFDFSCHSANARQCWAIDKSDARLTFILHHLPVHIATAAGVFAFIVLIAGYKVKRLRQYRELSFLALLGIAVVPAIITALKVFTNHYCPGQLSVYGGPVGFPELIQPRPRCFPASFPATGFGLLVLCFGNLPPAWRNFGLYGGLAAGAIMSIMQIARGEHFLTHCIATLLTALFVGLTVYLLRGLGQRPLNAFTGS